MPGSSQPISIRPSASSHHPHPHPAHRDTATHQAANTNPWSTTTTDDLSIPYTFSPSSVTGQGHAHNATASGLGSPGGMGSSWQNTIHPGPLFVSSSLASSYGAGMSMSFGSMGGSLGSRLFPGGGAVNPLDPTLKCAMPSSIESDHGSLIRALNGEIEHCQNYSCCGLALSDLHARVRHFEEAHVVVHGALSPSSSSNFGSNGPNAGAPSIGQGHLDAAIIAAMTAHRNAHAQQQQLQQGQHQLNHRSSDSALAGALGPVSSATFFGDEHNAHASQRYNAETNEDEDNKSLAMTGGVAAFDVDDMEMDEAPAPSSTASSSSSNHSSPESRSSSGSPPAGFVGYMNRNGTMSMMPNGGLYGSSTSTISSPPDTPLLSTPISPLSSTFNSSQTNANNNFPWSAQTGDGGATPLGNANSSSSTSNSTPTGPSAFDSFHLPAKSASTTPSFGGVGGAFSSFAYPSNGMYAAPSNANQAYARKGVQGGQSAQSLYAALRVGVMNGGMGRGSNGMGMGINGYAGYEQFSSELPGALALHPSTNGHSRSSSNANGVDMEAIQPELLFGASAFAGGMGTMNNMAGMMRGAQTAPSSEMNTPSTSRAPSPTSVNGSANSGSGKRSKSKDSGVPSGVFDSSPLAGPSSSNGLQASTTLSRPGASLLLSKPFKCPKPGCMKSYKQANGLKYHITHGQCNFNPPPELESLQGLSEREAERRLRPYCCQVAPCQRRYKNMNGLRYHYQHSGEHGAIGLQMLAEGRHDALRSQDYDESEAGAEERDAEERDARKRDANSGVTRRRGMKLDTNVANGHNHASNMNGNAAVTMLDSPMSAFPNVTATSLAAASSSSNGPRQNSLAGVMASPQYEYMQSQPASAYASPWTSPRSSPPLTPAAVQAQAQMQYQQQQQQQHFEAQQRYDAQQQQWGDARMSS